MATEILDSILNGTKKMLGLAPTYDVFDHDIILHINSVFSTLHQLGIGPQMGFMIEDALTTWDAFLGSDPILNSVKTYMYLRVRLLFDPPNTSFTQDAMKEQLRELEWRINVYRENSYGQTHVDILRPLPSAGIDGGWA